MKRKKILTSLLLVLTLLLSLSVPAFAVNAQYSTTRDFLKYLDEEDYKYSYLGVDNDNDEGVSLKFRGDNIDTIKINIFFDEDLDVVSMRIWYLIEFDKSDYEEVLEACNSLNNKYKFIKLYVDTSDWSVTAAIDIPIRSGSNCGEICEDGMLYLVNISDIAYETLKEFES